MELYPKTIGPRSCECCGRDFNPDNTGWICPQPHCGFDHTPKSKAQILMEMAEQAAEEAKRNDSGEEW